MNSVIANARVLRAMRLARGWSQEQAASFAGCSDRMIRRAENGDRMRFISIAILSQLYGLPQSALIWDCNYWINLRTRDGIGGESTTLIMRMLECVRDRLPAEAFAEIVSGDVLMHCSLGTILGFEIVIESLSSLLACDDDQTLVALDIGCMEDIASARWGTWPLGALSTTATASGGNLSVRVSHGLVVEIWCYAAPIYGN